MTMVKSSASFKSTLTNVVTLTLVLSLTAVTGSALIGAALGVSATRVATILAKAYTLYKRGETVRDAIMAVAGPEGWGGIIIDFAVTWGLSALVSSSWLKGL